VEPAFEEVDEAAAETGLGIAAGIDRNEIAHSARERKTIDLPDTERRALAIANLDQDDLIAAAASSQTAGAMKGRRQRTCIRTGNILS
jgi:hypothetical protein